MEIFEINMGYQKINRKGELRILIRGNPNKTRYKIEHSKLDEVFLNNRRYIDAIRTEHNRILHESKTGV